MRRSGVVRDPSIHITKSNLLNVCRKAGITFPEDFVDELMMESVKINIRNRVIVVAKSAVRKKLVKTIYAEDQIVEDFNRAYTMILKDNDIRAAQIYKDSQSYLTLKEIAKSAQTFCESFDMQDMISGFKVYVQLGVDILERNFSIYRLKSAEARIINRYENVQMLADDSDKDGTLRMMKAWRKSMMAFHSMEFDVLDPARLAVFVLARQDADTLKADYQDYMDAQFDKWTYLNAMPEFSQLYGENAAIAYHKYMATQGHKSVTEQRYFKSVKDGKDIPIKTVKRQERKGEA